MPCKTLKNSIIYVIDIGLHSKEIITHHEPFLEKAKKTIINSIKKMIFVNPSSEIAIVCYGSTKTQNDLQYNNVEVIEFRDVDWDVFKIIENFKSTDIVGNFEKAIEVANNYMESYTLKYSETYNYKKKIELFFNSFAKLDEQYHNYNNIPKKENNDTKIYCIGDKQYEDLMNESNNHWSIKQFMQFINDSCEEYWTIDAKIAETSFIGLKPARTSSLSNINLEYADIIIPISFYKMTADELTKPSIKAVQLRTKQYLDVNKQIVDKNDIIKAYKFGHKLVPISDDDQQKIRNYTGGEKSCKIMGFINVTEITLDRLGMSSAKCVLPNNKLCSQEQLLDFYSLMEAMIRNDVAAVVKCVLRSNDAPKVGLLCVEVDESDETKLFIFIEMPFEEQRYSQYFRPIPESFEINSDISQNIHDLILKTTMIKEDEKNILFKPGSVNSPSLQLHYDAIEFKIQHPEKELFELDYQNILNLLKQPKYIKEATRECAEKLREVLKTENETKEMSLDDIDLNSTKMDVNKSDVKDVKNIDVDFSLKPYFDDDIEFDDF